ncbi:hypothetical protein FGIG_08899 [Fasciola gigantica]|uniref:NWD1/2-like winged helix-turn-helix domain-containing protein n=1 Tax=Fasciola gigantica TaxID=46835 RepID=A0A504YCY4_FASGI|nr:hypothetical protein FGIG_08899 [Fasciola gigantica]
MDQEFVRKSKESWYAAEKALQQLFAEVVPILVDKGLMNQAEAKLFSCSVTEHEVILGLLNSSKQLRQRSAAFIRTITNLDAVLKHAKCAKFLDMTNDKVPQLDETRFGLINDLRDITLGAVLKENDIRKYEIPWEAVETDGVERKIKATFWGLRFEGVNIILGVRYFTLPPYFVCTGSMYLTKFCKEFESKVTSLIDKTVASMSSFENDDLYVEILQHLNACRAYVHNFQGRKDVIESIRQYVLSSSTDPFIIYGRSGSGKTSVLAKAASLARSWIPEHRVGEDEPKLTQLRGKTYLRKLIQTAPETRVKGLTPSPVSGVTRESSKVTSPKESAVVMVRFLGTSPGTSSIRQSLKYLSRQLCSCLSQDSATEEFDPEIIRSLDDFQQVITTFYSLLEQCASRKRWVLIFLDAIDQLTPSDGAYSLGWIRTPLPANVRIVISTLPDVGGILGTFLELFPIPQTTADQSQEDSVSSKDRDLQQDKQRSNFLEVQSLDGDMCEAILRARLINRNRTLQPFQWRLVRRAFAKCRLTFFVVLVDRVVTNWRSWHVPEFAKSKTENQLDIDPICSDNEARDAIKEWPNLELALTLRDAIIRFFDSLERSHGKILTSHALAFITASRGGLSEAELVEILSLDDEVLRDVFQHHLPPQIRAPPFVWARLRSAIGQNLVEREVDGVCVVFWYHRQFIEAAQQYFFSNLAFKRKIHSIMADYFLGKWAGQKKTFRYPEYLVKKLNLPESSEEERGVPPQPYVFEEHKANAGKQHLNLRKLNELPWHLVHAGRVDDFYEEVAFNYEFLYNKLRGTSRSQLLMDLKLPETDFEGFINEQTRLSQPTANAESTSAKVVPTRSGGLAMSFYPAGTDSLDELNKFRPERPITQLSFVFNSLRIAALSLDANPQSLAIDLLGRLSHIPTVNLTSKLTTYRRSRQFSSGRTSFGGLNSVRRTRGRGSLTRATKHLEDATKGESYLSKLLQQCRVLSTEHCVLFPRSLAFDSGSDLLHTAFDLGLGIGCLMSNNLILVIPITGEIISWYDLDGTLVKKIPFPEASVFTLKGLLRQSVPNDPQILTLIADRRSSQKSLPGETETDSSDDQETNRIMKVADLDCFTGRVTDLCTLSPEWSRLFTVQNTSMIMEPWLLAKINDDLFLGNWQKRKLVVDRGRLRHDVFWYCASVKHICFSLQLAAYVIDAKNYRIAVLPAQAEEQLLNLAVLSSGTVIGIYRIENEYKMRIFATSTNKEKTIALDTEVNQLDLHSWNLETIKSAPIPVPEKLKITNMTAFTSRTEDLIAYLYCARRREAHGFGVIWDHDQEEFVELQMPNYADNEVLSTEATVIQRDILRYTSSFGNGSLALFSHDNELLFTSGSKCFLLVWSIATGHLLRTVSQGSAEGFLCGISPPMATGEPSLDQEGYVQRGSVIVVCHFPDDSAPQYGDSPDQAVFIMCKIYNVDALSKPEKTLAELGSTLYETDGVDAATEDLKRKIITGGDNLGEPLTFEPALMSPEYVANDPLPTLMLVSYKKEARFEADSLVLYDIDDDCSRPVQCWATAQINSKSLDAFFNTEQLADWPSYDGSQLAFVHTTMNRVQVFTVFRGRCDQATNPCVHTFLDPSNVAEYQPNMYLLTGQGPLANFGLINALAGLLVLVRVHEYDIHLTVNVSDQELGLRSLWGEHSRVVHCKKSVRLAETMGSSVLEKRTLDNLVLTQVAFRPKHDTQLILGWSESVQSLHVVTRTDGRLVLWIGVLLIVDLGPTDKTQTSGAYPIVIHRLVLDYGPALLLMPDGKSFINYRLQKYDIETGKIIQGSVSDAFTVIEQTMSKLSEELEENGGCKDNPAVVVGDDGRGCGLIVPPESVSTLSRNGYKTLDTEMFIKDLQLGCSDQLLIGMRHHPEQEMFLDLDGESSSTDSEGDFGAPPARCLMAFDAETLKPISNYMLENEPYAIWMNKRHSTVIIATPNEYLRAFDMSFIRGRSSNLGMLEMVDLSRPSVNDIEEVAEERESPAGSDAVISEEEEKMNLLKYLEESGLAEILEQSLLEVANRRPSDPIELLAQTMNQLYAEYK